MRQKSTPTKDTAEKAVRDIRRRTRKQYPADEKIRIVLEGLRGEESIADGAVRSIRHAITTGDDPSVSLFRWLGAGQPHGSAHRIVALRL